MCNAVATFFTFDMSKRRLYSDNKGINSFTTKLTIVGSTEWTTTYFDESSGEFWLQYVHEMQGDGTLTTHLMSLSPRPTLEELIEIALNSSIDDEVSAAASRLYKDEQEENVEYRENLIARLLEIEAQPLAADEKDRIKLIIEKASLLHAINIRPIVGKYYKEIMEDAASFNLTSRKAAELLERL